MRVSLVHPPALVARSNYSTITQPPLGLAYLAAHSREAGHDVEVIDGVGEDVARFEPWPAHENFLVQGLSLDEVVQRIRPDTDLIGVTCMFTHSWPMVRELMRAVKNAFPHVPLIAGGEHVTAMPELVLDQVPVTACVLGEGEETFGELLTRLERGGDLGDVAGIAHRDASGAVVRTAARKRIRQVDELPLPAWDLLDPMAYLSSRVFIGPRMGRSMPMLASRGCPYQCTFCSSPNMWGTNWRVRSVSDVVDEMAHYKQVYAANDFQFQDLTAIINKRWIVDFCRELIERDLDVAWQLPVGTRSEAIDGEVSELLMRSGCRYIQYAAESGSERILKSIKKRISLSHLEEAAIASVRAGMTVSVLFMVGFPEETREDLRATFRLIRRLARKGVHEIAVSVLVPLPNTEVFRQLEALGEIAVDDGYCYWMAEATSLTSARSLNPALTNRRILLLKLWGLAQFYAISHALHPTRVLRVIRNTITGRQESKVDRVLRELVEKAGVSWRLRSREAARAR